MKKLLLLSLFACLPLYASQNKGEAPVELTKRHEKVDIRKLVTLVIGTQDTQLELVLTQALDPKAKKPDIYPELVEMRAQVCVLVRTLNENNK